MDSLRLPKDKRHKSTCSLATLIETTWSERKIDLGASIPEDSDHFAKAETRCDVLQEKINLVKSLKRKKKLKRRSITRIVEQSTQVTEKNPFISVKAQPKKQISQHIGRTHRFDTSTINPIRGYLDPTALEQHNMLGHVRGYSQLYERNPKIKQNKREQMHNHHFHVKAEGDRPHLNRYGTSGNNLSSSFVSATYTRNQDYAKEDYRNVSSDNISPDLLKFHSCDKKGSHNKEVYNDDHESIKVLMTSGYNEDKKKRFADASTKTRARGPSTVDNTRNIDQRPVVELFNKVREQKPVDRKSFNIDKKVREVDAYSSHEAISITNQRPVKNIKSRRFRYRNRRYELPTISSQLKQASIRYYSETARVNDIPFVVSKSTAPSHNIGVNIQQVLNGIKIQQPLSGIPLTIAHHMGLRHVPTMKNYKQESVKPSLDISEINIIKVGRRLLRLPSYKYVSYSRLLNMYKEGEGMVPRYMKAISRPQYFYTSMYNLSSHKNSDGASAKNIPNAEVAKERLTEYASLYREYEKLDKAMKSGNLDVESEIRKNELAKELTLREESIRQLMHDFRGREMKRPTLRATASTAEDTYRYSSDNVNLYFDRLKHTLNASGGGCVE